jgi:hypothetical protein
MTTNTAHPIEKEFILRLIQEALKSHKFFNTLLDLGLDNSYYQPELDDLICTCMNITDESNETLDRYFAIMNEESNGMDHTQKSMIYHACKAYEALQLLSTTKD